MKNILQFLLSLLLSFNGFSQQTMGLFLNEPTAFDGYTLFEPQNSKETYLINNCGIVEIKIMVLPYLNFRVKRV